MADDERSMRRLRERMAAVEAKKGPLLLSLTSALSSHGETLSVLRSRLSSLHATFSAEEAEAHAVFDCALQEMEAAFALSLQGSEAAMRVARERQSELQSFAGAEEALRRKAAELTEANRRNEERHRLRLREMEERWELSRQAVRDSSDEVRRASELRYQEGVKQAMHIDYSPIQRQLDSGRRQQRTEAAIQRQLQGRIQRLQADVQRERGSAAEAESHRMGRAEQRLTLRLQLRATQRETGEEAQRLADWRRAKAEEERRSRRQQRLTWAHLQSERRQWQRCLDVGRRQLRRLQAEVGRVEALRARNPFHALTAECLAHTRSSAPASGEARHEHRVHTLHLLFTRLRDAEMRRAAAREEVGPEVEETGEEEFRAAEPGFFLTQPQLSGD